jgi:hypothetical protein
VEQDIPKFAGRVPAKQDTKACAIGMEVVDGRGSRTSSGKGRLGETSRSASRAEELDAIGKQLCRAIRKRFRELIDPGDGTAGVSGTGNSDGGFRGRYSNARLVRKLAAELPRDRYPAQGKLIGGASRCSEVQLYGVADAVGDEVANRLRKMERWGMGRARAGAANGTQDSSKSSAAEE